MSPARVLVTGATGTTGSRVVAALRASGADVRTASRRGSDVPFDWRAPDTFAAVLEGCRRIYLVPPTDGTDAAAVMLPFVDLARRRGVERIVLLSSSALPSGGPATGQVHAALAGGPADWVVLRPSWFMQNVTGDHPLARGIRDDDRIVTATGDGRVAFVDADDIAAVAARALLDEGLPASELVLTGPEALSYADVARIVGAARGRSVAHRPVAAAELAALLSRRYPPAYAEMLAQLDVAIAAGAEDRVTDTVQRVTGRPPAGFAEFAARAFRPAEAPATRR